MSKQDFEEELAVIIETVRVTALANKTAQVMSKHVPHAIVLNFFFDNGNEGEAMTQHLDSVGSSDEMLEAFVELDKLPKEGPFSEPRFDFDLKQMQKALPVMVRFMDAFIYNLGTTAVTLSKLPNEMDRLLSEKDKDNMFSPAKLRFEDEGQEEQEEQVIH